MELRERPRRLRSSEAIRRLVAESTLSTDDLIWPLFIHATGGTEEVAAMPGVLRHDMDSLLRCCEQALEAGIPAVAVFPVVQPELLSEDGAEAWNERGMVQEAIRSVKRRYPELLLLADVALDPYTSHGHDGLMDESGAIVNDASVEALVRQALSLAESGADIVAPSDMMDGRIGAIRDALEASGRIDTMIMSYAAKYASCFYGPFREAIASGGRLKGDKRTYQLDPANRIEAAREIGLDIEEGADMVMVKPGLAYLDIIAAAAEDAEVPVFAYSVSGEYAMIKAAAERGWIDGEKAMLETLLAFKRAGCAGILTYFAPDAARALSSG